ncbi:hypothetical protein BHM03_00013453, partial [Ensete ventricosum]
AAFIGGWPPPVGGRTSAAYARLLPARGRCLSAASARRLPLPHSRDRLLARGRVVRLLSVCGRRSTAVLP